jgi:Domain of unknown function (DUF222)
MIEYMFESSGGKVLRPEAIARNDALAARRFPATTAQSAALVERIAAAGRAENQAAGCRLAVIAELDVLRLRAVGERDQWCVDTREAVAAEVAAALGITAGLAESYVEYARVMRLRLPEVGALLVAGDIDYRKFQTIVYRTELITDAEVMRRVDATLAAKAARWPAMTRHRLAALVDRIVARADADAVRRRKQRQPERELSIWDGGEGLAEVFGRLVTTDAQLLDARLDGLAASVCAGDPRTRNERRADAMGALAAGAQRLACRCGRPECPAASIPAPTPVIVHVIAEQAALDGTPGASPGSMIGADGLISAELIAELAATARLQPLTHPRDTAPEKGYLPSKALADFIRCRDLTCRFPNCDRPATHCDLDHTIPHAEGGPTHASNLKCLCRHHHLIKTFWGWRDQQLPDGVVIWTAPTGHTYITTPGSALLFPALCAPTGQLAPPTPKPANSSRTDSTAKMPTRQRTRTQNRAARITTERRANQRDRIDAQRREHERMIANDEPPPF